MWGRRIAAVTVGALVVAGCGSTTHATSSPTTTGVSGSGSASASGSSATTAVAPSVGSGGGASVGITKTTITVGQLADVSGPVPGLFTGAVDGMDAWAADVNSTGGIDGRKVVVDHQDAALSCPTYTNAIKTLATSVFADVGTFSLVDVCGEATLKANPNFEDIEGAVLNSAIEPVANVISPIPAPNGFSTTGYLWVKDTYGAAAVAKTADLWGSTEQFDFAEQEAAAESIGYKYVYNRGYAPTETNFTSDILRMKSDGVEVVDMIDTDAADMADFLEQSAQQNFHPKAVITAAAYDPSFFKDLGNPADAAPLVMPLPFALYLGSGDAAAVPEVATFQKWMKTTHPGDPLNLFGLDSFAAGLLFQTAMSKLDNDPTQAQLATALHGITSFDADGLIPTDDPSSKQGAVCYVIVKTANGGFVRTAPPKSGYLCNGVYHYFSGS
jgi:ABC-type branched-subunit amino acid transport system substrate-binding protein